MPSNYAHYRFGTEVLPALPPALRRAVYHFRDLYDLGLHGPDLFFYYSPPFETKTGSLGGAYHAKTGRDFFQTAARLEPTEANLAYLCGVLCHYCLDSRSHPTITAWDAEGKVRHLEIEVEFDRHLLTLDGKTPAHTQNLTAHLRSSPGICETVAAFYPPAQPRHIRRCIAGMKLSGSALSAKGGLPRSAVRGVIHLSGHARELLMHTEPNPACTPFLPVMEQMYRQALADFPAMARELAALVSDGAPLGPLFAPDFG